MPMSSAASEEITPLPLMEAVPGEIWSGIFRHLRRPIPAPLSRPPRSALKQPDLVAASKVCKLFNILSNEILYAHIVTDDLPRLFSPPTLASSRNLFAHTRALYIEYRDKRQEASYEELLELGRDLWADFGPGHSNLPVRTAISCEEESVGLRKALQAATEAGVAKKFPRLRTVAVASVFGTDMDNWDNYACLPNSAEHMVGCHEQFDLFLRSGHLRDVCIRDSMGPLSTPLSPIPNHPHADYTVTIHSPPDISHVPLSSGRETPIRFTVDHHPAADFASMLTHFEACMRRACQFVYEQQMEQELGAPSCLDPANIEVYLGAPLFRGEIGPSTTSVYGVHLLPSHVEPKTLSSECLRAMTTELGRVTQKILRQYSGLEDRVTWRVSAEAPVCEACGTGPPEEHGMA